jgi:cytochrome P450
LEEYIAVILSTQELTFSKNIFVDSAVLNIDLSIENLASTFLLFLGSVLLFAGLLIHHWYFKLINSLSAQISHADGRSLLGETPKFLLGNLADVYQSKNRLSAYYGFHKKFGEVVQIFWLWRHQFSTTSYQMARYILIHNQNNYEKFPPNALIQKLYGSSVLTNDGEDWKRHRLLLNEVFSKKRIIDHHNIFVSYSEKLVTKWCSLFEGTEQERQLNIYSELIALFLDIIGQTALGYSFCALDGKADQFLNALHYVLNQSTRPVHQFAKWWQVIPLPSNQELTNSFAIIENFLNELISQRIIALNYSNPDCPNVLDLLLQATVSEKDDRQTLTEAEVRDNLVAIIVNGHETVATSVALSLYLLAQHPEKLACAQAEVDSVMKDEHGKLKEAGVLELHYLDSVINESLRLCPAVAGLQRISTDKDILEGWTIPSRQVVGIALQPLHLNSQYFGEHPEQFRPERYLKPSQEANMITKGDARKCPFNQSTGSSKTEPSEERAEAGLPFTFGDGARKCLGEHFARYEMKVAIAILLYHFDFQVASNFEPDLELGKFGLFITMFPKGGIELVISRRQH